MDKVFVKHEMSKKFECVFFPPPNETILYLFFVSGVLPFRRLKFKEQKKILENLSERR